jgi:hypothetical protein
VVGEVVECRDDGSLADDRVVRIRAPTEDAGGSCLPVVRVDDVDGPVLGPQRLQRGTHIQPEPPRIVLVIACRVAVEPGSIERRGMVDQSQPVAIRVDVDEPDLA